MSTLDLGDVINLQFNVINAQGVAANATAVTLVITQPDGTTVPGIVITNPPAQTGAYLFAFTTTQAGRHQVYWVATGSNAMAYNDVFDVRPSNPPMIFSLASAKESLRSLATDTTNDDKIRDYIAAVTNVIETLYGIVVQRSFTEQRIGGSSTLDLSNKPVVSITSVTEYLSGISYPLTQAATPDVAGIYGYTFDAAKGSITRRVAGGLRMPFLNEVWVTYVSGLTIIPDNVLLAARELLRFWWQFGQEGRGGVRTTGASEDTVTVVGYAVPRRVIEMLGHLPLSAGFA